MKIAVVGAGIFGVTIALALDAVGQEVYLYDKQSTILNAASRVNQNRLHMGYHYPRSIETMRNCLRGLRSFTAVYGDSIFNDVKQIYCIAKAHSKTDRDTYLSVLDAEGLPYVVREDLKHVKYENIDLAIEVPEKMFNFFILKGICLEKLAESKVNLCLNVNFTCDMIKNFDQVVVTTYCDNNDFCVKSRKYQFELVEKLLISIPGEFSNFGTVVLDGGYCCIDPLPDLSGLFLMGHVDYAIHSRNVGSCYFLPTMHNDVVGYAKLLNKGVIPASSLYNITKAPIMIEGGRKFFNYSHNEVTHIGSMFTYRVVLPEAESTDNRPSLIERVDEKVVTVLGGKIPTVVETAKKLVEEVIR